MKAFLHVAGSDGLPLVLVDGVTAMTGRYPDRAQLAAWAGVEASDVGRDRRCWTSPKRALPGTVAAAATAQHHRLLLKTDPMKFLDSPATISVLHRQGRGGQDLHRVRHRDHAGARTARVLLVSTDPASNVGQVFGLTIGNTITAIPAVEGLSALEIDPEQAADAYRERIIGPVRGLLPDAEVASITEQLSGSCTTEIASFNEFTELLTDSDGRSAGFDHVLFDTAPTGHTIRLLQLPGSWTDFLNEGKGDASCLGPLSGSGKTTRRLRRGGGRVGRSPAAPAWSWWPAPRRSTLAEITRTHRELAAIGLTHQYVVINGVLPAPAERQRPARRGDLPAASSRRSRRCPTNYGRCRMDQVDLKATNIVGLDALATLFTPDARRTGSSQQEPALDVVDAPLASLIDELATGGPRIDHVHGQGRGRQDDHRRRDRRRPRRPRPPGAPDHDRPGRAPHRNAARNTGEPAGVEHRPGRGDPRLPRPCARHQGRRAG